ncbi:ankyrin repeat protein, partial [Russula aff. rugulosa BPL654]
TGNYGNTPLHSAACRDLEMVEVLLEYGVDVNAQNSYCRTPLSFAAGAGRRSKYTDSSGFTPLHDASEDGNIEIARVLLEHGANVEVKDNEGRTPLDIASGVLRGQHEIVKLLLEHNARREDIVP